MQEEQIPQQTTPQHQPQSAAPGQTQKPVKILCIEDEHFISELYTRALKKAGYDVTVIITGPEGLKAAQTNQYDIILLDLMLPDLTGAELLETLRDKNQTPELKAKVVVATNLEQKPEERNRVEQLADGYVIKAEVTPHQLVDFLSQLSV